MRPTALVPITEMPLVGQELFHWTEFGGVDYVTVVSVFESTARVTIHGQEYPQLVNLINLYTAV